MALHDLLMVREPYNDHYDAPKAVGLMRALRRSDRTRLQMTEA